MNPIRTILVDDEAPVRKRFRQMLSRYPQVSLEGEAASVAEAERLLASTPVDLVFLDIVMPGADGFALVDRVPATAGVVFVTAHEQFARRAFDVAAVDYLLKPVDPDRLTDCLNRVQAQMAAHKADTQVTIEEGDRVRRVAAAAILAVEQFADSQACLHIAYDTPAIVSGRLGEWAERLAESGLVRVGRSLAIRPSAITHLERLSRNEMVIDLRGVSKTFRLGRTAAVRVNRLLGKPALAS